MTGRITALGALRIYDKKTGEKIMEGKMTGMTFRDEKGNSWIVKRTEPKKCPHCGAELK